MNSANTSEQELAVVDDTEKPKIDSPGAEKGHAKQEPAGTLEASSNKMGAFLHIFKSQGNFVYFSTPGSSMMHGPTKVPTSILLTDRNVYRLGE